MESINPAIKQVIDSYTEASLTNDKDALDRATTAFLQWRNRPLRDRERLIQSAGDVLRENKQKYAEIMTREMENPISQTIAEVEKCA